MGSEGDEAVEWAWGQRGMGSEGNEAGEELN